MKYNFIKKKFNKNISKLIDCDMMDCFNISDIISTYSLPKLKVYQYSIKHWNERSGKYFNFTILADNPKECHLLFRNYIKENYNTCPTRIYVRYYNQLSNQLYTGNSRILNVTLHSTSLLRPSIQYLYKYNKLANTSKLSRKQISIRYRQQINQANRTINAEDFNNLFN